MPFQPLTFCFKKSSYLARVVFAIFIITRIPCIARDLVKAFLLAFSNDDVDIMVTLVLYISLEIILFHSYHRGL